MHTHTHTHEQFLKMSVDLGLVFVHLFWFSILHFVFFWLRFDFLVPVLFALAVLGLGSSVLCQEIGWEERL